MRQRRPHSIEFKRQVAQAFIDGETLHALAKRHDLSRNLIRIWVQKLETGGFDEEVGAAALLEEYETRIAALERMVGRQTMELEYLKGAVRSARSQGNAPTSVIAGPAASLSPKDAG